MERLLLFPEPFPDEALYSLAVRYHRLVASNSYRGTSRELFGTYSRTCGSVLPCCLGALSQRLNGQYSVLDLAESHTLLPLYKPFINTETYESAIHCMQGTDGTGLKMSLGITASRLLRYSCFRYCDECVQRDYEHYGTPYWHRIHMATGSCVCPHHNTVLLRTVFPGSMDWRCMTLPGELPSAPVLENSCSAANAVTKMQFWALNNPQSACELLRNDFLKWCLSKIGLFCQGRWREQAIVDHIENRFRGSIQEREYQTLASDSKWVMTMLRRRGRIVQPFRYYFVCWLFGADLEDVHEFEYETHPSNSKKCSSVTNGLSPVLMEDLARFRYAFQNDNNKKCHEKAGYYWLYRHDRCWLKSYIKTNCSFGRKRKTTNWHECDFLLSREILSAYEKIISEVGRPVKITKSALLRNVLNNYGFLRRGENFPRTLELIKSLIETECEYQTRKISWVIKTLPHPKNCAVSVIMRFAGIRVRRISKSKIFKLVLAECQRRN